MSAWNTTQPKADEGNAAGGGGIGRGGGSASANGHSEWLGVQMADSLFSGSSKPPETYPAVKQDFGAFSAFAPRSGEFPPNFGVPSTGPAIKPPDPTAFSSKGNYGDISATYASYSGLNPAAPSFPGGGSVPSLAPSIKPQEPAVYPSAVPTLTPTMKPAESVFPKGNYGDTVAPSFAASFTPNSAAPGGMGAWASASPVFHQETTKVDPSAFKTLEMKVDQQAQFIGVLLKDNEQIKKTLQVVVDELMLLRNKETAPAPPSLSSRSALSDGFEAKSSSAPSVFASAPVGSSSIGGSLAPGQAGMLFMDGSGSNVHSNGIQSEPVGAARVDDDTLRKKKISRIHSSVPNVDTSNPIAALINFCKHQLRFDVDFRSWEEADGSHTVKLYFPNEELVSDARDRKKKSAKEDAAKKALVKLNNDEIFLGRWIDWSLTRP